MRIGTSRLAAAGLGAGALALAGAWWLGAFDTGQKLPGRLVSYHAVYDRLWDVACDSAVDGSDRGCYIQYVDVYRPRPDFAAAMVELVYHAGPDGAPDPHIRFDIEPGLSFRDARIEVVGANGRVAFDLSRCPKNTCRFSGDEARQMVEVLRTGEVLQVEIGEGRDEPARREWPLGSMGVMLADFEAQRARWGVP